MQIRKLTIVGIAGLALGAVLVGVAIVMDSALGRAVNGVGGLFWFASTALLTVGAIKARAPRWLWLLLVAMVLAVAFVVKPSAAVLALIGFIPAGLLMGAIAPNRKLLWAALVPAWYLPAHIGTAVTKSALDSMLGNEASLRTDPPPTAAFVPLLMICCAVLGGAIVAWMSERRRAGQMPAGRLVDRSKQ